MVSGNKNSTFILLTDKYMPYILSTFTLVLFFIYLGIGLLFSQDRRIAQNGGNALI